MPNVNDPRRFGAAQAPFGFASLARPAIGSPGDGGEIVPVMDNAQPYPRPGFTPVPPDIFREWRKHATRGLTGLIHALDLNIGGRDYDPGEDPECWEEYAAAYRDCMKYRNGRSYFTNTAQRRGDLNYCIDGQIPERCKVPPDRLQEIIRKLEK